LLKPQTTTQNPIPSCTPSTSILPTGPSDDDDLEYSQHRRSNVAKLSGGRNKKFTCLFLLVTAPVCSFIFAVATKSLRVKIYIFQTRLIPVKVVYEVRAETELVVLLAKGRAVQQVQEDFVPSVRE